MKLFPKGYQFLDNYGNPVSNGTITVFIHQTTTLILTGQRNPAPLTTRTFHSLWSKVKNQAEEPGGRLMEDIYSDQPCDVEIRDCNGAILWRQDHCSGSPLLLPDADLIEELKEKFPLTSRIPKILSASGDSSD